jgi:hypothetical protein
VAEEWVWPSWLHRQLDGQAFVSGGPLSVATNLTRRNVTMVGNLASPARAMVDPCGLVTPWTDGWSLDWWIGAEDRWHHPSQEASVRQSLVGCSPVVETAMRVPGGDAVHRTYAVTSPEWGELLLVEVENRSAVPFAVALGVRPYNGEGMAVVERIILHDDRVVTVDGRPALLLGRPPSAAAMSSLAGGDVVASLVDGSVASAGIPLGTDVGVRCRSGMAHGTFVYPLAHTAVLRVAVPMTAAPARRGVAVARRRVAALPELPKTLTAAAIVARGWDVHARRGMRLELPEGGLADAVEASRRSLLLFHIGDGVAPEPGAEFAFRDASCLLRALDCYGFHDESAEVLRSYPARQRFDGKFREAVGGLGANGCALHAAWTHWRLSRDDDLLAELLPSVARGARWIAHQREGMSSPRARLRRALARRWAHPVASTRLRGLMPPGGPLARRRPGPEGYWDEFWSVAGLYGAAELLSAGGNQNGSGLCRAWGDELKSAVLGSLDAVAERLGAAVMPAGADGSLNVGMVESLVACHPLELLRPHDPRIEATLDVVRRRYCGEGDAVVSVSGLLPRATLQLAAVELLRGERCALRRLRWLVESATSTYTWPEAIHPAVGGGCGGAAQHGWATASFLSLVRDLLVREVEIADPHHGDALVGLALCSMLPDGWEGRPVEVHDAPTAVGRVSFVLRWHGRRPALLWELEPHTGVGRVRVTAPGLDPMWSSSELRGDALLMPPGRAAVAADG